MDVSSSVSRVGTLGTLAANTTRQLDVFRHDGDSLGVDRAQIRVLEQADEIRFARLLQRHHGRALESQVRLEVLCDFAHQSLEGQLSDEQLGALLVASDLAQSHRAGPVAMRLLHAAGGRRALAGRLRRQLLARRLAAGRLASRLLRASHRVVVVVELYLYYNCSDCSNV